MEFLKYSNETQSNIIPKDSFDELVHDVFRIIASNLAKSLGPLGSSTTILDGVYTSATKDGFSIFKSLRFHNRYKSMIYNLIKVPCTKLNNTVGDGTTTAIVLTDELFNQYAINYMELAGLYYLPRDFNNIWDEVISVLIEKIRTYSEILDPSDYDKIYNISYVASNGNSIISENIAETYKNAKSPTIKIKSSPTNKSYVDPIIGFEFPANMIDQIYAKSEDLSVEEKDLCVMIFDHKIETDTLQNLILPINEILKLKNKKLLILAPYYDALMLNTVMKQYLNHEFQKYKSISLILGQYSLGDLEPHQLDDLAIVLRSQVIDQETAKQLNTAFSNFVDHDTYEFVDSLLKEDETSAINKFVHINVKYTRIIGNASSAILSCTNGSLFKVNNIEQDQHYIEAMQFAEKELNDVKARIGVERQAYAFEISKAQARISQLKMENYIYYVGSDSELQRGILKDSVDDVVKCVRSAIKSGIVPGCQIAIIKAIFEYQREIVGKFSTDEGLDADKMPDLDKLRLLIANMIKNALVRVYFLILCGPEGLGIRKLIPLWNHVDEEGQKEITKQANDKCAEIINESIKRQEVFDLSKKDFSKDVITSAETDINVLTAASELIKILISGNQCIFLDADVNNSHQEQIETYA
jgi:chaperonin GroEL (HSP60 family)